MNTAIRGTIKELSEVLAINNVKLNVLSLTGLLNALAATGDASVVGKTKTGTKGRPSAIWEIKDSATLAFAVPAGFVSTAPVAPPVAQTEEAVSEEEAVEGEQATA